MTGEYVALGAGEVTKATKKRPMESGGKRVRSSSISEERDRNQKPVKKLNSPRGIGEEWERTSREREEDPKKREGRSISHGGRR